MPRGSVHPGPPSGGGYHGGSYYHAPYYGHPYYGHPYYGYGGYYRYGYPYYGYGYYPYYGPGWGFSVSFGYPGFYGSYGYYGYPYGAYPYYPGYVAVAPGRPYGGVRLDLPQRDAQVFVDGYFVGIVDNYDGNLQQLNLDPGTHRIEIAQDGFEPASFNVSVQAGQTITYRTPLRPAPPQQQQQAPPAPQRY